MEVQQKDTRFQLENEHVKVVLSSFGATIVSLELPDKDGKWADCVLGYDTMQEYDRDKSANPYFGATVGRVANRIKDSKFTIHQCETHLDVNDGDKNHLHGGHIGYHRKMWQGEQQENSVKFNLKSENDDQRYPGCVEVEVTYKLQDNELLVDMKGSLEAGFGEVVASPINMTNHSYFNLDGHDYENGILDHELKIIAGGFTPTDAESIPTKQVHKFANNQDPMAFMESKNMKEALYELGKSKGYTNEELDETILQRTGKGGPTTADPLGFDHNYVLNDFDGELRQIAELKGQSGRIMEVFSSTPGVQLYTGNYIDKVKGKAGVNYLQRSGLCLETQSFPDSIGYEKDDDFSKGKCFILEPGGEEYSHVFQYKFKKI